jgi:hypothetical protein
MLMREVGSSRGVRARPARVCDRRGRAAASWWPERSGGVVQAACRNGVPPAAMAGSQVTR